jgi:hypothetical protein
LHAKGSGLHRVLEEVCLEVPLARVDVLLGAKPAESVAAAGRLERGDPIQGGKGRPEQLDDLPPGEPLEFHAPEPHFSAILDVYRCWSTDRRPRSGGEGEEAGVQVGLAGKVLPVQGGDLGEPLGHHRKHRGPAGCAHPFRDLGNLGLVFEP